MVLPAVVGSTPAQAWDTQQAHVIGNLSQGKIVTGTGRDRLPMHRHASALCHASTWHQRPMQRHGATEHTAGPCQACCGISTQHRHLALLRQSWPAGRLPALSAGCRCSSAALGLRQSMATDAPPCFCCCCVRGHLPNGCHASSDHGMHAIHAPYCCS
jgi:hypothetical protein